MKNEDLFKMAGDIVKAQAEVYRSGTGDSRKKDSEGDGHQVPRPESQTSRPNQDNSDISSPILHIGDKKFAPVKIIPVDESHSITGKKPEHTEFTFKVCISVSDKEIKKGLTSGDVATDLSSFIEDGLLPYTTSISVVEIPGKDIIKEIISSYISLCEKYAIWDKVGDTYMHAKALETLWKK